MPIGKTRNMLYGLALPVLGKACAWKPAKGDALQCILHRHHVAGACIQRFEKGTLTDCTAVGYASLEGGKTSVTADTLFRTASIAKMVTALLVMRLQTKGLISVGEDVGSLLGFDVRNPHHPDTPLTLGMLLSHTSSIVDSPAYFARMGEATAQELLGQPDAFLNASPGARFRYSNFAAGLVACALETRFGMSLETLAQQELFQPLGVFTTYDITQTRGRIVADSYRVLPSGHAFDAQARLAKAQSVLKPDPERHYVLASGNLFISAPDLARLVLVAWNGAEGFLDERSLRAMHTPIHGWPEPEVNMRHGMGLLMMDEPAICPHRVWGHQGFAYGAVNGVFFDEEGSGFVCLNSGASEQRLGHLALINRDLIRLWMKK